MKLLDWHWFRQETDVSAIDALITRYVSFQMDSVFAELRLVAADRQLMRYVSYLVDSVIADLGLVRAVDTRIDNLCVT